MKKILFFTHKNPQGYRIQQYFPFLQQAGFTVGLVTTETDFLTIVRKMRDADIIYIQRLLFPPLKKTFIRASAKKIIFDFDDAIMYGIRSASMARRHKFKAMMHTADAVFCGNHFLVDEAKKYRKNHVYYVPTVVNTREYPIKKHHPQSQPVVGWMGSGSTLRYAGDLLQLFSQSFASGDLRFKIVADKPLETANPAVIFEKLKKSSENDALMGFDIGVMPLRDDLWSRGNCGLKLIQYMASGLPSISHPIGAAKEIIVDGENGFLRDDIDGWRDAIEVLARDVALRKKIGAAARKSIEEKYSLSFWGSRVAEMIAAL